MTPEDRAIYGFARTRDVAFDAVRALWHRRRAEGMTQKQIAEAIGKDTGWVSRNLRGPGNWTLRTIGAFVEALNGDIEISVSPIEAPPPVRTNYHAYAGYEVSDAPMQTAPSPGAVPRSTATPGLISELLKKTVEGTIPSPAPAVVANN
jgi:transcriptional regulator with XRE-family HTH domain